MKERKVFTTLQPGADPRVALFRRLPAPGSAEEKQEGKKSVGVERKKPVTKPTGMYFYSVPGEVKDIINRYCFWEQKTKTETLVIFVKDFYKRLGKDELPEIPEDKNILKHIEELKAQHKQELEAAGNKT